MKRLSAISMAAMMTVTMIPSNAYAAHEHFSDIEVIFLDKNISYEQTVEIENQIKRRYPKYNWEIKNQFYMNRHSPNTEKYVSSTDAVSKFPEKCTAISARQNDNQELEVFIPFGTDDLIYFIISPTKHYY